MQTFKQSDIQINNSTVSVKEYTSDTHFNWVCVANFHHNSGIDLNTNEMARKFAESITK